MLKYVIIIVAVRVSYATKSCHELQQSQLASLSERMSQMLGSLYSSPATASGQSNTTPPSSPTSSPAGEYKSFPYEAFYPYPYGIPAPQVIYVAPPPPTVSFVPPPPIKPSIAPARNPYYYNKEVAQPFEIPSPPPAETPSPWQNYYEQYPYPQYPFPQYAAPYPSAPYSVPYPYPELPAYPQRSPYPPTSLPLPPPPPPAPVPYPPPPPPTYYSTYPEIPYSPYYY